MLKPLPRYVLHVEELCFDTSYYHHMTCVCIGLSKPKPDHFSKFQFFKLDWLTWVQFEYGFQLNFVTPDTMPSGNIYSVINVY